MCEENPEKIFKGKPMQSVHVWGLINHGRDSNQGPIGGRQGKIPLGQPMEVELLHPFYLHGQPNQHNEVK